MNNVNILEEVLAKDIDLYPETWKPSYLHEDVYFCKNGVKIFPCKIGSYFGVRVFSNKVRFDFSSDLIYKAYVKLKDYYNNIQKQKEEQARNEEALNILKLFTKIEINVYKQ